MNKIKYIILCTIISAVLGAAAGWIAARYEHQLLIDRIEYFERLTKRQGADLDVMRNTLLSGRPDR